MNLFIAVILLSACSAFAQTSAHVELAIRVRSDGVSFSLRDNIHLEIARENIGNKSLLICRQWGWGTGRTQVRVFDSRGKEVVTDFLPDELPPPPQPFDYVLLEPREFIGLHLEEPTTHFVNQPGEYELIVEYTSYLSEKYARDVMKMPDKPFWSRERGLVISNRIKLHITD